MSRLNRVTRATRDYKCGKCGDVIAKGSPYVWWKFRYTGKYRRCSKPECQPAYTDYATNNPKKRAIIDIERAISNAQDASSGAEAAEQVQAAIDAAEGLKEELQNALDGWEGSGVDAFTQTDIYYRYESAVDELDSWIGELEGVIPDLENLEDEPEREPVDTDGMDDDEAEAAEAEEEVAYEQRVSDWEEEFENAKGNIPEFPGLDI